MVRRGLSHEGEEMGEGKTDFLEKRRWLSPYVGTEPGIGQPSLIGNRRKLTSGPDLVSQGVKQYGVRKSSQRRSPVGVPRMTLVGWLTDLNSGLTHL